MITLTKKITHADLGEVMMLITKVNVNIVKLGG